MLVLTVYESKGLEFDDVILYNFFNFGGLKSSDWKFMHNIQVFQYEKKVAVTSDLADMQFDQSDPQWWRL